jgi:hypothetical protein
MSTLLNHAVYPYLSLFTNFSGSSRGKILIWQALANGRQLFEHVSRKSRVTSLLFIYLGILTERRKIPGFVVQVQFECIPLKHNVN